ncbi:MAG TPA: hypothetical protein VIJ93_06890, partial [bacterium]
QSVIALKSMMMQRGIETREFYLFNESLIPRARNYIADEFMRSGFTHLMFIDSDIGFDPDYIFQLLALADPQSDKDIIAGPYPKKTIAWEKIKRAVDMGYADEDPNVLENFAGDLVFNPMGGEKSINLTQPLEVSETGTGFMMIQRKAFEKYADLFTEYLYTPDHVRSAAFDGRRKIMSYFHCDSLYPSCVVIPKDEQQDRYLSEDYWFCRLCRTAGAKTWLCPWMELSHVGTYIFTGSLVHMAQLGISPTADMKELNKHKKKKKTHGRPVTV